MAKAKPVNKAKFVRQLFEADKEVTVAAVAEAAEAANVTLTRQYISNCLSTFRKTAGKVAKPQRKASSPPQKKLAKLQPLVTADATVASSSYTYTAEDIQAASSLLKRHGVISSKELIDTLALL